MSVTAPVRKQWPQTLTETTVAGVMAELAALADPEGPRGTVPLEDR